MHSLIQQNPSQDVIENHNQNDRINHRFGHRSSNTARTAAGDQSLMTTDDANDQRENETLEYSIGHVLDIDGFAQCGKERGKRNVDLVIRKTDESAPQPSYQNGKHHQHWKR